MTVDDEVGGHRVLQHGLPLLRPQLRGHAAGLRRGPRDLLRINDADYRATCTELTPELWATEPWYNRYVDNVCRLMSAVL